MRWSGLSVVVWIVQAALVVLSLTATECFNLGTAGLALRHPAAQARVRSLARCGGVSMQSSDRPDGATEQEIKEAYATYEELMRTNNFGQGYWMDAPFQFFTNIQQAIERNFGKGGRPSNPLEFFDNSPKVVDLSQSKFKPLIPLGEDLDDDEPAVAKAPPAEAAIPVTPTKSKSKSLKKAKSAESAAPSAPASSESLSETDALKRKLAELEAAKKKAEEEAARIKAQLSE